MTAPTLPGFTPARPVPAPAQARFWGQVTGADFSTCWEWTGRNRRGYGTFRVGSKEYRAHRFAYEQMIAEVPDGLVLDHLCRNRACVNPWHLEPVTSKVNTLRGLSPAAANSTKTHCPQGHAYAESGRVRGGVRYCLECRRQRDREAWQSPNGRSLTVACGTCETPVQRAPGYLRRMGGRAYCSARCAGLAGSAAAASNRKAAAS